MAKKEEEYEKKKRAPKHHEDCGDVGDTGKHGEIGSNAAGTDREVDEDEETTKEETEQ